MAVFQTIGAPLLPRPILLPGRVPVRLVPRLQGYASKVSVRRTWKGTTVELTPRFISNSVDPDGVFHEYYVFLCDGNPEAFMDLTTGPKEIMPEYEKNLDCEVCRMGWAKVDVYLEDKLMVTFSEITAEPGPWVGYAHFWIPKT